jgi:DNA-binding SARP family transcriptional activator
VDAAEWRTGKTVDLLRLLALNVEQPVRIDSLLDKLWPDVEESKGRASLRTAASQIRRTLRSDCIERRMGGLVLTNAWVDVAAFRDLAVEARACHRAGDHAKVVCLTRQAEAMYLGDFEAHDGGSDWAVETRQSMASMRVAMLTDAVESAVELRWLRDAVDLATLVIDADPYSDRGHRGLMGAYAGLGETDHALRVFADFRLLLDDELGIPPSAQTQALQMSLLTGTSDASQGPGWVGHEDDCTTVASLVRETIEHGVRVLCVTGPAGSGREAVIDAALDRTGVAALRLQASGSAPLPSSTELEAAARRSRVVVLPPLDACDDTDVADLVSTLAALKPVEGVTVVVPVDGQHLDPLLLELEMVQLEVGLVELHTLTRAELERLAGAVLCGPLAPGLTDTLMTLSDGLSGKAATELRRWLADGRILWTPSGLDLASSYGETPEPEIDKITRRILERVCPLGMDVVSLLALLDRPATAALVVQLLDRVAWPDVTENDVDLALDQLADLGALRLGPRGYEFMHRRMRATTEGWLRHGVRRRLHRRLAESPLLPEVDRAGHWIKAAAPVRASESAVDAARVAHETGDDEASRRHLTAGRDYASLAATGAEQMSALHRVSEMASEVGAAELAAAAVAAVVDVALTNGLPSSISALRPETGVDLTARAALLEEAVLRALEPLLPGAQLALTLSVVPNVRQPAAIESVACTDNRGTTTVPVQRPA